MSREAGSSTRRDNLVSRLVDTGAVAVVRLKDATTAAHIIDAICAGGIRAVEITLTTPNALALIEDASRRFGDEIMVGVGSVLDAETARSAIDAGARYIVSPVFSAEVVEAAHAAGLPALPGAFSPTEILRAHHAGADIVKVFPAEVLGIPFFRAVLGPMPFLRIMPTGGVTPENAGDWIRAGAVAVGIGSALLDPELIAAGNYAGLTERARVMAASVAEARKSGSSVRP
jgi:2-dehydro-3-deoxyphosphogluconate aldolase / (4S)-4-hydroxy-2-oxoglutarate aldolase